MQIANHQINSLQVKFKEQAINNEREQEGSRYECARAWGEGGRRRRSLNSPPTRRRKPHSVDAVPYHRCISHFSITSFSVSAKVNMSVQCFVWSYFSPASFFVVLLLADSSDLPDVFLARFGSSRPCRAACFTFCKCETTRSMPETIMQMYAVQNVLHWLSLCMKSSKFLTIIRFPGVESGVPPTD